MVVFLAYLPRVFFLSHKGLQPEWGVLLAAYPEVALHLSLLNAFRTAVLTLES